MSESTFLRCPPAQTPVNLRYQAKSRRIVPDAPVGPGPLHRQAPKSTRTLRPREFLRLIQVPIVPVSQPRYDPHDPHRTSGDRSRCRRLGAHCEAERSRKSPDFRPSHEAESLRIPRLVDLDFGVMRSSRRTHDTAVTGMMGRFHPCSRLTPAHVRRCRRQQ